MNNNKIDFYDYMLWLKQKLQIDQMLCVNEDNPSKIEQFGFILDNI